MTTDVDYWIQGISTDSHKKLRKWAAMTFRNQNHFTQCRNLTLSASAWRILRFGHEDGLIDFLSANLVLIAAKLPPSHSMGILKAALIRSALENHTDVFILLSDLPELASTNEWIQRWSQPSMSSVSEALLRLEGSQEEITTAWALAARKHPELITADWIEKATARKTATVATRCLLSTTIQSRTDLATIALPYFSNPHYIFTTLANQCVAELVDRTPELTTAIASQLDFAINDHVAILAARNLVENNDHDAALNLLHQIRPLSPYFDQALLLCVHCYCALGSGEKSLEIRNNIDSPTLARQALACCADALPDSIESEELINAAISCTPKEPETFYKLLLNILRSGNIEAAQSICNDRMDDFSDNSTLNTIMRTTINH